jgi:hypothetical protein
VVVLGATGNGEPWSERRTAGNGRRGRPGKIILQLLLSLLLIGAPHLSRAQDTAGNAMEYQVKAAFLYKFCFYVEWPASAFAAADSPIVLGIIGPDELLGELRNVIKNHTVEGRPLQVQRIERNAGLTGLHVLFVARFEQAHLPQLLAQAQGLPLLVVTESPAGLDDGSGINFAVQDERVRFDVSLNSTGRQGLRLSAQLLKVARSVRGEAGP